MAKKISCRDVGVDCDYEAEAETEEELMRELEDHAREDHGMEEIPQTLLPKIKGAIREA